MAFLELLKKEKKNHILLKTFDIFDMTQMILTEN